MKFKRNNIRFECNFIIVLLFLFMNTSVAYPQSGADYIIKKSVVDMAGSTSSSTNYSLVDAVGQSSAVGAVRSINYVTAIGFIGGIGFDTSVLEEVETLKPSDFKLFQNYPNPFNQQTSISYRLKTFCKVKLEIYNALGQLVAVLADGDMMPGAYKTIWNGRDISGKDVPSGLYFYRLKAGDFEDVKKIVVLK